MQGWNFASALSEYRSHSGPTKHRYADETYIEVSHYSNDAAVSDSDLAATIICLQLGVLTPSSLTQTSSISRHGTVSRPGRGGPSRGWTRMMSG